MKIRYIKYWGALVSATLLFSACKKDYLDIQPTDRIATSALQSDSTVFEAYVTNRYIGTQLTNKEGDGTPPGFGRGFEYAMWSSLTDESIYNNDDDTWLIQRGQLSPDNLGIANVFWGRGYRGIRECNFALSLLPNVPMSALHRNRIEGELKFVRAFRYFDLIRNYGGIVLMGDRVTQLGENFQDPALFKRSTIKESIDYVTAQLDDASAKLPLNNDGTWINGRATKGAALALKSRLLLYAASPLYAAGTWEAAANAAQAVIGLNKYNLYSGGYGNMFLVNETSETIFARYYTRDAGHVHLEIANGPNGYGGWAGNSPLQNLVDDYEMSNGKAITDPTSGFNANDPYANRDPRFAATIFYNGAQYRGRAIETFIPGGRDSRDGSENWNTSKTGYYLKKFINETYPIQNPWGNAGFQTWTYFRLSEILLNFAEAANEAYGPDVVPPGATYSARTAVNAIRARAGVNMPALANVSSKDQMRDAIRHERRIELAFEEHRFYDVRRWRIADVTENKPAMGVTITKTGTGFTFAPKVALDGRNFQTRHYWLPIPRAEIQASSNQLQQNSGYNN